MTRGLHAAALVICAALVACVPGAAPDATSIAHHFDASTEGWRISGDTGMTTPDLHTAGGRSAGYISGRDEGVGETWYFHAPDSVLAALPGAHGGTLAFSLKLSSDAATFLDDDVVIVAPSGRLSYRFSTAPGDTWTDFSVRLSTADPWRWNWNVMATDEQIREVLAQASRLEIRGEYHTGSDEGGLDDFVLTAAD